MYILHWKFPCQKTKASFDVLLIYMQPFSLPKQCTILLKFELNVAYCYFMLWNYKLAYPIQILYVVPFNNIVYHNDVSF